MLYFLYSIKRIVPVVFISFLICLANLSANKFIAFICLFLFITSHFLLLILRVYKVDFFGAIFNLFITKTYFYQFQP